MNENHIPKEKVCHENYNTKRGNIQANNRKLPGIFREVQDDKDTAAVRSDEEEGIYRKYRDFVFAGNGICGEKDEQDKQALQRGNAVRERCGVPIDRARGRELGANSISGIECGDTGDQKADIG